MKHPLFILFALAALVSFAQPKEQLDTVYYGSNWKGYSPTFATYYRVMTIPTDDNHILGRTSISERDMDTIKQHTDDQIELDVDSINKTIAPLLLDLQEKSNNQAKAKDTKL